MIKRFLSLLAVTVSLAWPMAVLAQEPSTPPSQTFNPNLIIADDQLLDTSMSPSRIQEFLNSHAGILKNYVAADVTGVEKPAVQIISEAAQAAQINPKFLLVTLQKEESLIDDDTPSQVQLDWATGYGFCDKCTTTTPSIQQYKGFGKQVWNAAQLVRRYLNNLATIGVTTSAIANTWGVGKANTVLCLNSDFNNGREICTPGSTITITPSNSVTAILYTYTPHPGGNYAFWKIWNLYNFTLTRFYPDGSLLKAQGTATTYLIQNGLKRRFTSTSAFLSRYSPNRVITIPADHLAQYDNGRDIAFANYSLLSPPTGGVYLLVDDVKRPIKTKKAFLAAGFQSSEVVKASWEDLSQYPDGEPITTENIYPSGILMQNKKTGGVFFVKDGVRHAVVSRDIYQAQFGKRKTIWVTPEQLLQYASGVPVGFPDGFLVQNKTGGPIYFISNGERLPIASWAAMQAYGFDKILRSMVKTNDASIAVHPSGPTLDVTATVQTASLR